MGAGPDRTADDCSAVRWPDGRTQPQIRRRPCTCAKPSTAVSRRSGRLGPGPARHRHERGSDSAHRPENLRLVTEFVEQCESLRQPRPAFDTRMAAAFISPAFHNRRLASNIPFMTPLGAGVRLDRGLAADRPACVMAGPAERGPHPSEWRCSRPGLTGARPTHRMRCGARNVFRLTGFPGFSMGRSELAGAPPFQSTVARTPRGRRGLGGSSVINGMVAIRAVPDDYKPGGPGRFAAGWSYHDMFADPCVGWRPTPTSATSPLSR